MNEMLDRKAKWKELSGILGFTPSLDGISSSMSNKIIIDVMRLDNQMIRRFGYDVEKHGSLSDFIKMKFGDRASELVGELI